MDANVKCKLFDYEIGAAIPYVFFLGVFLWIPISLFVVKFIGIENAIIVLIISALVSIGCSIPLIALISNPIRKKKLNSLKKCIKRFDEVTVFGCYICSSDIHFWEGCKCQCGSKIRDEEHTWDGCICRKCEKTRDKEHTWDGCKCRKCRKTRDEEHTWDGCMCRKCLKHRGHIWDGCNCKRCGQTLHNFVWLRDESGSSGNWDYHHAIYKCTKCGIEKTETISERWENRN
jgi:hypothetical protein